MTTDEDGDGIRVESANQETGWYERTLLFKYKKVSGRR